MSAPPHRRHARPRGPLVLGLECGGEHLGVALLALAEAPSPTQDGWQLIDETLSARGHRHADAIAPIIRDVLERHELELADLALIGVARGPGGFTGVRVGLATALGLSMGLKRPCWPVCSLLALARNALGPSLSTPRDVLALIDARKHQTYGALFRFTDPQGGHETLMPPRVDNAETLVASISATASKPWIIGSGALEYQCASDVPATWHRPSAMQVALVAAAAWEQAGRPSEGPALDPVYIRRSEAEEKALARNQGTAP